MRNPMEMALERLSRQTILTADEAEALLKVSGKTEPIAIGVNFVRGGEESDSVTLIVRGMAARTSVADDGSQQITALYVAGDIPDLHSLMQPRAVSSFRAVTSCDTLRIPHKTLHQLTKAWGGVMEAFWRYTVWDASVTAEWVANIGARMGPQRVAHLFCELAVRSGEPLHEAFTYKLPLTQSTIAEATGLSTVHVNRSLKELRTAGLLVFNKAEVTVPDWKKLTEAADFSDAYLGPEMPLRLR